MVELLKVHRHCLSVSVQRMHVSCVAAKLFLQAGHHILAIRMNGVPSGTSGLASLLWRWVQGAMHRSRNPLLGTRDGLVCPIVRAGALLAK